MYEAYFGLQRPPFKISPDTSLFFEGGKRGDILAALVYAIHRGEGIIKVVGEVGSGKTMLCRMLQLKLPKTVEIIYIANPSVSAEDILFVIAHELELPAARNASKHEVVNMLQDYLLQRHIENKQVVLFIEEAQGMPLDTLEEIRLLSNLETDQHKLLQIILFGQPELDENLSIKSIRQLRERITHNFDLSPLTADEIHAYLNFRMREVGYTGPELITVSLAKKVAQYSGGLLRRINIIGDKILLSAYAEGTHSLTPRHVVAAVNDSAFGDELDADNSRMLWWLVIPILIALALAVYKSESLWSSIAAQFSGEVAEFGENPEIQAGKPVEKEIPVTESVANPLDTDAQNESMAPEMDVATVENSIETSPATPVGTGVVEAMATPELDPLASTSAIVAADAKEIFVKKKDEAAEPSATKQELEQQSIAALMRVDALSQENDSTPEYFYWLETKLQQSRDWLSKLPRDKVSIQVMMSKKSAARELVEYLQNDWPLNLDKTYLYEVNSNSEKIYRVFYSEFESVAQGRREMQRLPESVKVNSPYLHSVHRMQKALL